VGAPTGDQGPPGGAGGPPFDPTGPKPPSRRPHHRRRIFIEIATALLIGSIFTVKLLNYVAPSVLRPSYIANTIRHDFDDVTSLVHNLPVLNQCHKGLYMHDVTGGYVCAPSAQPSIYRKIFTTYPLVGQGREAIYASTDQGSLEAANDLLHNQFDTPRYPAVTIPSVTWSENNFNAVYWRLEFYSLRPSLNLLYAFRNTGDPVYAKKLRQLDQSFIKAEPHSLYAWEDSHAVAFRAMALVDTWWKLRQAHQLSVGESTAILQELVKTGQYLADPNHYQPEDNHGTNEAAALYEIAVAFPDLPGAHQWLALARERFNWQLSGLVDGDGQLIENSPYYDFYTLDKYWQIYTYSVREGDPIAGPFQQKLSQMLNFATYILQPNSQVPLLGASIQASIQDHGVYQQMAATDPSLLYVLTHGAHGSPPPDLSVYFRNSGLTIMRSNWGSGSDFAQSTYSTFNIGKYRTAHSDLDALDLTLYGEGGILLTDPGLYTYTPGAYRNYFHGTLSHNTVIVDGISQDQGNGVGGALVTKDGVTYQSGESSLYPGVTHRRMVMMLDPHHMLVEDELSSGTPHSYQQLWHLFPGARLTRSGLTITGSGGQPRRKITISQLLPKGVSASVAINQQGANPNGLCSEQYGKLVPCYAVNYTQRGRFARYLTLITIGGGSQEFHVGVKQHGTRLAINDDGNLLSLATGKTKAEAARAWATDAMPPPVAAVPQNITPPNGWQLTTAAGTGNVTSARALDDEGRQAVTLTAGSAAPATMSDNNVSLNLEQSRARLRMKISGLPQADEAHLTLTDNNGQTATVNLLDEYNAPYAGDWHDIFLGPGAQWQLNGGWNLSAPTFNWSAVRGMSVLARSQSPLTPVSVSLDQLGLIPAQKEAKVVFVFDDGYQSILPAADYMHRYHLEGNVAVIGKYVDYPTPDHLNLFQLKMLQNRYGWDMANHTQFHQDAYFSYFLQHNMNGYANDILQQAVWLERHGLNSAPNWLIYPHGATNSELESVVARYYKFARTTVNDPDAYPYGDPHAVNNYEVLYPGDGETSDVSQYTSPSDVLAAVHQAMAVHGTIILTFHRIHTLPSDPPGYPLPAFEQIVRGISQSGVKVLTLSQLDRSNGVPVNNHIEVTGGRPSLITVNLQSN
jgi:hypothetical protein